MRVVFCALHYNNNMFYSLSLSGYGVNQTDGDTVACYKNLRDMAAMSIF